MNELAELSEQEIDDRADKKMEEAEEIINKMTNKTNQADEEVKKLIQMANDGGISRFVATTMIRAASLEKKNLIIGWYPEIIDALLIDEEEVFLTKEFVHSISSLRSYGMSPDKICKEHNDILSNTIDDFFDDIESEVDEDGKVPRNGATVAELSARLEDYNMYFNETKEISYLISDVFRRHIGYFTLKHGCDSPADKINSLMSDARSENVLERGINSSGNITDRKDSETSLNGIEYQDKDVFFVKIVICCYVSLIILNMERTPENLLRTEAALAEHVQTHLQ